VGIIGIWAWLVFLPKKELVKVIIYLISLLYTFYRLLINWPLSIRTTSVDAFGSGGKQKAD
jgi:hypothetical protein